jgi:hypothetical protein
LRRWALLLRRSLRAAITGATVRVGAVVVILGTTIQTTSSGTHSTTDGGTFQSASALMADDASYGSAEHSTTDGALFGVRAGCAGTESDADGREHA